MLWFVVLQQKIKVDLMLLFETDVTGGDDAQINSFYSETDKLFFPQCLSVICCPGCDPKNIRWKSEVKPILSFFFEQPTISTFTAGYVSAERSPDSSLPPMSQGKELDDLWDDKIIFTWQYKVTESNLNLILFLPCLVVRVRHSSPVQQIKSLNAFTLSGMPTGCRPLTRDDPFSLLSLQESPVQPSRRLKQIASERI